MRKARFFSTAIVAAISLSFVLSGCTSAEVSETKGSEFQHDQIVTDPPSEGSRGLTQIDCYNRSSELNAVLEGVAAEHREDTILKYYLAHESDVRLEPNLTDINDETNIDLERYLTSTERHYRFKSVIESVGPFVYEGLMSGTFGKVSGYDSYGQPLMPKYTGWGDIHGKASDTFVNAYIQAWLTGDGYIDIAKIHALSIVNKDNLGVSVYIDGPEVFDNAWSAEYEEDGVTTSSRSILKYVTCLGWGVDPNPEDSLVPPTSLREVKELDERVLNQIQANTASWHENTAG